jgi:hydroxyacylglutathione hydrolase
MLEESISIISIAQLKDNYSYLVLKNKKVIIIDPAESTKIIQYIKKNQLNLIAILLTHHHLDHTAGVSKILDNFSTPVYSSDQDIAHTTNVVKNGDFIDLDFIEMEVINTPGHTLDHIVFYNETNHILFSGDALFRLGCGRIFEGTYEQMFETLKKINFLDNKTMVYCGHEYTSTNLDFLISIFPSNKDLISEQKKIKSQLAKTNKSIPFNLGKEKLINPFLSTKSEIYRIFKNENNFSDIEMFSYLRDLKNKF